MVGSLNSSKAQRDGSSTQKGRMVAVNSHKGTLAKGGKSFSSIPVVLKDDSQQAKTQEGSIQVLASHTLCFDGAVQMREGKEVEEDEGNEQVSRSTKKSDNGVSCTLFANLEIQLVLGDRESPEN